MSTPLVSFVSELLSKLGFSDCEIKVFGEQRTVVAVSSPNSKELIGPDGEHLRSLNTVARRIWESTSGKGAPSFLIDVDGYHESKLETVRASARMLAQRARLFKHDVEMPPLSSYERLVVHELFFEDPEIKTESAGEGKFRHIVLKYKTGSVTAEVGS